MRAANDSRMSEISDKKRSGATNHRKTLKDRLVGDQLVTSLDEAERKIRAGLVRVAGAVVDKPGALVRGDQEVTLESSGRYVGRGALKLKPTMQSFGITVSDLICADVGSSTGGFTQVLLEGGARRVYAIDVGYGELDWRLRSDDRVVVMERTNARYLEALPEPIDFVTIDVSFISLSKVVPSVMKWLTPTGQVLALIKPQFEAPRAAVGDGGIVRDPAVHQSVLESMRKLFSELRLMVRGCEPAAVQGSGGNQEFLLWGSRM